jgi:SAM-dependent methyltransferase
MPDSAHIIEGTGNMERDWDLRARANARFYIECTRHLTEVEFDRSGEQDLATVVLRDLQLDPEAIVLEIGCGIGRLLKPLASMTREVHGVDVSGEMIARARERVGGRANVRLHKTSGADLASLPDSYFDLCFSFITFQHIPLKEVIYSYFAEVSRVLKPAGVFWFQVDGRTSEAQRDAAGTWDGVAFDEAEIRDRLSRCGFETVDLWGQHTQSFLITAVRRPEVGPPPRALVHISRRAWNRASVEALAKRICGAAPDRWTAALLEGSTSPRRLADQFLRYARALPPEEYVSAVYEVFLNRPPDELGLRTFLDALGANTLTREGIVDNVISSQAFHDSLRPTGTSADAVGPDPGTASARARGSEPVDKAPTPACEGSIEILVAAVSRCLADAGVTEDDDGLIRQAAVSVVRLAARAHGEHQRRVPPRESATTEGPFGPRADATPARLHPRSP